MTGYLETDCLEVSVAFNFLLADDPFDFAVAHSLSRRALKNYGGAIPFSRSKIPSKCSTIATCRSNRGVRDHLPRGRTSRRCIHIMVL
jgi:hypothetical protein